MSADGTWKLSMQTPIGERKSTLALQSSDGALTGKLTGEEGNSTSIYEGKLDGNNASWKADIKNPMPLTLTFTRTRVLSPNPQTHRFGRVAPPSSRKPESSRVWARRRSGAGLDIERVQVSVRERATGARGVHVGWQEEEGSWP